MLTENREEVFEDNTIVEFRYDSTQRKNIGVGYLYVFVMIKPAEYRKGLKNYGNAFHVAESVWHSIHVSYNRRNVKDRAMIFLMNWKMTNVYYKRRGRQIIN